MSTTDREAPRHQPLPQQSVTPKSSRTNPPRKPSFRRTKYRFGLRTLRYYYHRLVRMRSTPQEIARGVAIGIFFGCLPMFGLQMILSLAIATLLRGYRIAAAAATWISNPFTYFPLYAFGFQVGRALLGYSHLTFPDEGIPSLNHLSALGGDFLTALFFGCIVVGSIFSFCSYWGSLSLIQRARQRRHKPRLKSKP